MEQKEKNIYIHQQNQKKNEAASFKQEQAIDWTHKQHDLGLTLTRRSGVAWFHPLEDEL